MTTDSDRILAAVENVESFVVSQGQLWITVGGRVFEIQSVGPGMAVVLWHNGHDAGKGGVVHTFHNRLSAINGYVLLEQGYNP